MAKLIVVGRLGQDPEIKTLQSGSKMAKFSVAETVYAKDGDTTVWWDITCWENSDAFSRASKAHKGSYVQATGNVTKVKDGDKTYVNMTLLDLDYLSSGTKKESGDAKTPSTEANPQSFDAQD
jgi:single-strand DNA-binding protein